VLVGIALFVIGGIGAYEKIAHVRERIVIWLHPWTTTKVYCPSTGTMALRADGGDHRRARGVDLRARHQGPRPLTRR
jgi:hypothetical protein